MNDLVKLFYSSDYYKQKLLQLKGTGQVDYNGLIGAAKSVIAAALAIDCQQLVVVTAHLREAEKWRAELVLLTGKNIAVFPPLDDAVSPSKELLGRRLAIKHNWLSAVPQIVLIPISALQGGSVSPAALKLQTTVLQVGQAVQMDKLTAKLVDLGYKRFDIVGEIGEFSVRGGIIDLFSANQDQPLRIELSDNKIESLRLFDPFTQRSVKTVQEFILLPMIETSEGALLDHLPIGALLLADEQLELAQVAGESEVQAVLAKAQVRLSSFLRETDEPHFHSPPIYRQEISAIPRGSFIFRRHAARLKEEYSHETIPGGGGLRGGVGFAGYQVLTDRELFGEEPLTRSKEVIIKEGVADELLSDLKPGDYVVHENY